MKRLITLVLVTAIICSSFCQSAFAITFQETASFEDLDERAPLNMILGDIQASHPNAQIIVENGVINVVLPAETTDASIQGGSYSTTNTIVASDGGTWDSFYPPLEYQLNPDLLRPYQLVFLPAEYCAILYDAMEDEIIKTIIDDSYADNLGLPDIQEALEEVTGMYYTYPQITFLAFEVSVGAFRILNAASLRSAINNSTMNKVKIQFATSGGWPVNYYTPWNDNLVSCTPWEAFNPVFNRGEFSIGYGV